MKTNAPQIIILTLYALQLFFTILTAYLHGKNKTGEHNVFTEIIGVGISFALLSWGGFF